MCFSTKNVFVDKESKENVFINQKLNKNVKKLARRSALTLKLKSKSVTVVEDFDFESPKTKVLVLGTLRREDGLPLLNELNENFHNQR